MVRLFVIINMNLQIYFLNYITASVQITTVAIRRFKLETDMAVTVSKTRN